MAKKKEVAKDANGFPIKPPKKIETEEVTVEHETHHEPETASEVITENARRTAARLGALTAEALLETYSIRWEWPDRKKIELLVLMWDLTCETIAQILGLLEEEVQQHIQELEDSWRSLGRPLAPEDRELARGRQIAELERLRQQFEEAYLNSKDPKFLEKKAVVLDKLAKLRGIEADRNQDDAGDDGTVNLKKKIGAMDVDTQRELLKRLQTPKKKVEEED
jgi:hypothetical protein